MQIIFQIYGGKILLIQLKILKIVTKKLQFRYDHTVVLPCSNYMPLYQSFTLTCCVPRPAGT